MHATRQNAGSDVGAGEIRGLARSRLAFARSSIKYRVGDSVHVLARAATTEYFVARIAAPAWGKNVRVQWFYRVHDCEGLDGHPRELLLSDHDDQVSTMSIECKVHVYSKAVFTGQLHDQERQRAYFCDRYFHARHKTTRPLTTVEASLLQLHDSEFEGVRQAHLEASSPDAPAPVALVDGHADAQAAEDCASHENVDQALRKRSRARTLPQPLPRLRRIPGLASVPSDAGAGAGVRVGVGVSSCGVSKGPCDSSEVCHESRAHLTPELLLTDAATPQGIDCAAPNLSASGQPPGAPAVFFTRPTSMRGAGCCASGLVSTPGEASHPQLLVSISRASSVPLAVPACSTPCASAQSASERGLSAGNRVGPAVPFARARSGSMSSPAASADDPHACSQESATETSFQFGMPLAKGRSCSPSDSRHTSTGATGLLHRSLRPSDARTRTRAHVRQDSTESGARDEAEHVAEHDGTHDARDAAQGDDVADEEASAHARRHMLELSTGLALGQVASVDDQLCDTVSNTLRSTLARPHTPDEHLHHSPLQSPPTTLTLMLRACLSQDSACADLDDLDIVWPESLEELDAQHAALFMACDAEHGVQYAAAATATGASVPASTHPGSNDATRCSLELPPRSVEPTDAYGTSAALGALPLPSSLARCDDFRQMSILAQGAMERPNVLASPLPAARPVHSTHHSLASSESPCAQVSPTAAAWAAPRPNTTHSVGLVGAHSTTTTKTSKRDVEWEQHCSSQGALHTSQSGEVCIPSEATADAGNSTVVQSIADSYHQACLRATTNAAARAIFEAARRDPCLAHELLVEVGRKLRHLCLADEGAGSSVCDDEAAALQGPFTPNAAATSGQGSTQLVTSLGEDHHHSMLHPPTAHPPGHVFETSTSSAVPGMDAEEDGV